MHSFRGRAHTNLRLVDRIRSVDYAEDTVQWTTETLTETAERLIRSLSLYYRLGVTSSE